MAIQDTRLHYLRHGVEHVSVPTRARVRDTAAYYRLDRHDRDRHRQREEVGSVWRRRLRHLCAFEWVLLRAGEE